MSRKEILFNIRNSHNTSVKINTYFESIANYFYNQKLTYFTVLTKLKKSRYFETNWIVMNELNSKLIEEAIQIVGFATALKEPTASWDKLMTRIAEDLKKPQLFDAQCYADFSIDEILLFLRRSHDFYLAKKLPEIEQQLVHLYTKFPEYKLFRILYLFFQEYKSHLIEHINHEENTLFKYTDYLLNNSQNSTWGDRIILLQGSPSLNHFLETHTDTEKDLSAMRKVLKTEENYRQLHPISMLLHQLATLENHLNIHARIEDEVFVPKALELEANYL